MPTVASPLVGCATLVELFRRAPNADYGFRKLWDLVWDKIPSAVRSRVTPSQTFPEVFEHASVRATARWRRWDDESRIADLIFGAAAAQLRFRVERNDRLATHADERVWDLVNDWLWPQTADENGVWKWSLRGLELETDKPTKLALDERRRVHDAMGPAITYSDGFEIYAWRGVRVPADVITQPSALTVKRIDDEENAEVKRVMIERFGAANYIQQSGAVVIARDKFGVLYRKDLRDGEEPITMVEVINSTPEPDGSLKHYWLRVDPSCETPREAVAWTFGLTADEYDPVKET